MDVYLSELVRYLAGQSWQIATLTLAVAIVTWALRHRTAHIRYLLWLIVLAKCLVPPFYAVPLRVLPEKTVVAEPMAAAGNEPGTVDVGGGNRPGGARVSGTFFPSGRKVPDTFAGTDIFTWVGVGWMAGAGVYLVLNLLRALRGQWWLGRRRRRAPDELMKEMEAVLAQGGRGLPRVWVVDEVGQPFVWGLVRGSIYVPAGFAAMGNPEQRRQVLAHELSHVQRWDAGVNLLQILAQGVFWFHPLVWWANRNIRREREKCCDEMAVAQLGTKASDYCHAVVETLAHAERSARPVPSLAVAGPVGNTKERVRTMLRPGKKFYRHPSPAAMLGIGLMAAVAVSTALVVTGRAGTAERTDDLRASSEQRAGKATEGNTRRDLPEGWSLKYDDGLRAGGRARTWKSQMADDLASLEAIPSPVDRLDKSWRDENLEFTVLSLAGERAGTIHTRRNTPGQPPGMMVFRPGRYALHYRREGGKHPDNFWMSSGPFEIDMSKPGMYELRFAPKLGRARITGTLGGCYSVNFERMGPGGKGLAGTYYQYPPERYALDGMPAGRYRLSAVDQLDGDNVFVSQAEAVVAAGETVTVNMPAPPTGDCSLKGTLRGRLRTYKTPWPIAPPQPGEWFVLIRNAGSGPVVTTPAYEAQTMDSRYVIRGSKIVQETEDTAQYSIQRIAPGEYTVTVVEDARFKGFTIERQQSKRLILKAGEEATLDFDLRETSKP